MKNSDVCIRWSRCGYIDLMCSLKEELYSQDRYLWNSAPLCDLPYFDFFLSDNVSINWKKVIIMILSLHFFWCSMQRIFQATCCNKMTSSYVNVSTIHFCIFVCHNDALNTAQTKFIVTWKKTQLRQKMADTESSFSKVNKSKRSNSRFHCDFPDCQNSYTYKHGLEKHVSIYHENQRFECEYPECQKSYTEKTSLQNHVSSYHENRRFQCEYPDCQKSFIEKRTLENHVLSYHENRGFRCEYPAWVRLS